jgi:gamma-glutamyltranspeptidase/glutathione hydrolase
MANIAIASGSRISADAGATIAAQGGNAVDAAIAGTLVSMCTDLGVMAPGAGGFINIWPANEPPIVLDAYAEMPGRGLSPQKWGQGIKEVCFDYGGQMSTGIGYGSVATPGIFAGLARAAEEYGCLSWSQLLEPTRRLVENGFLLTGGAAEYLTYVQDAIFSWHPESYRVLHHPDGTCLQEGEIVRIPELANSLKEMAENGVDSFYTGTISKQIAAEIQGNQGLLTSIDLEAYQVIPRNPISILLGDWDIVTNPTPAVGGACVAGMLLLLDNEPLIKDNLAAVKQMAQIQKMVLDYRYHDLEPSDSDERESKAAYLLELARNGIDWQRGLKSPSTIHTSTVDTNGLACSITASAGYGSGVMITDTGLWLNNSLGELELNPQGIHHLTPGTRLISNMAPTIARHSDGSVIAIGSPGASRITTAIVQVLHNFLHLEMPLVEAINRPRIHVENIQDLPHIAFEKGIPFDSLEGFISRPFAKLSMYFGGVQAAFWHRKEGLTASADCRREGAIAYGGETIRTE